MPPRKPLYRSQTVDVDAKAGVEKVLNAFDRAYDLVSVSPYQVGMGFGAKVAAVITWRRRGKLETAEVEDGA